MPTIGSNPTPNPFSQSQVSTSGSVNPLSRFGKVNDNINLALQILSPDTKATPLTPERVQKNPTLPSQSNVDALFSKAINQEFKIDNSYKTVLEALKSHSQNKPTHIEIHFEHQHSKGFKKLTKNNATAFSANHTFFIKDNQLKKIWVNKELHEKHGRSEANIRKALDLDSDYSISVVSDEEWIDAKSIISNIRSVMIQQNNDEKKVEENHPQTEIGHAGFLTPSDDEELEKIKKGNTPNKNDSKTRDSIVIKESNIMDIASTEEHRKKEKLEKNNKEAIEKEKIDIHKQDDRVKVAKEAQNKKSES